MNRLRKDARDALIKASDNGSLGAASLGSGSRVSCKADASGDPYQARMLHIVGGVDHWGRLEGPLCLDWTMRRQRMQGRSSRVVVP